MLNVRHREELYRVLPRRLKATAAFLASLCLLACASPPDSSRYDANSWQAMIPASCRHFFDGCNTCTRAQGASLAACTRKARASYERPECLDEPASVNGVSKQQYRCAGGEVFTVFAGEYRADDMRVKLAQDELWLSDAQTHTAHRLSRVRSASGEKYSDGELTYWTKGDEALIQQAGRVIYSACRPTN
ncbi:MliC family protein [Gilvimarinus algae]|uniref:MliC family protein n=1 Tax=Gilvimarinus algae TaxID=3058037 RepID=A0ABT8TAZ0_9GAMM|nr:MliC family protein [Gilvimarinus sp. SDUM040014]MDO3381277.1 MliC family protein [Gilvimarinus sp. SDUM040014]